ncbi:MAG: hypothetical protein JSR33_08495 [Proteobacteria bacterium]|nr:hypothetical protein [Pseudomonadota bacterium]
MHGKIIFVNSVTSVFTKFLDQETKLSSENLILRKALEKPVQSDQKNQTSYLAVLKHAILNLQTSAKKLSPKTKQYTKELIKFLEHTARNGINEFIPEFDVLNETTQSRLCAEAIEWQLMLIRFSIGIDELSCAGKITDTNLLSLLEILIRLEQIPLVTDETPSDFHYEVKMAQDMAKDIKESGADIIKSLPPLTISLRAIQLLDDIREYYRKNFTTKSDSEKHPITSAQNSSFLTNLTPKNPRILLTEAITKLKQDRTDIAETIKEYSEWIVIIKKQLAQPNIDLDERQQLETNLSEKNLKIFDLTEKEASIHQQIRQKEDELENTKLQDVREQISSVLS